MPCNYLLSLILLFDVLKSLLVQSLVWKVNYINTPFLDQSLFLELIYLSIIFYRVENDIDFQNLIKVKCCDVIKIISDVILSQFTSSYSKPIIHAWVILFPDSIIDSAQLWNIDTI